MTRPLVVGLTGSVGMGKSTTAQMFRDKGVPVWDADAAVHALYEKGGAGVEAVRGLVPGAVRDGAVDRSALRDWVTADGRRLPRLEAAIHPLVAADRARFLREQADLGVPVVVIDVPLLFETGLDREVDWIVVVSAPPGVQRERVLSRPGMTEAGFRAILARQTPDGEKRRRANSVIETISLDGARAAVDAIVDDLRRRNVRDRP